MSATLTWKPHPLLPIPTDEEFAVMEPDEIVRYHHEHHEAIANSEKDPYRYGFRLAHWDKVVVSLAEDDEALILGGNRSGKTEFAAWAIVKAAVENPDSTIFCFAQNAKVSIRQQQSAVWKNLPVEYRKKILSEVANVSYTRKNGFTDGSFILPNGSQVIFLTYSQFQQDDTILEGAELGSKAAKWINIGVWLDEYLGGPALIDTLRNRLATRDSKMIVTFTPLKGWTEVVRTYLEGAKTLEEAPAEMLGGEKVPTLQKCKDRSATVHYFHSISNPFNNYERLKRNLKGKPRAEILVRAYGVPTKSHTAAFPKFSTTVNVVPHEMIPTSGVTRYQIIDPAPNKNWFVVWIAVDEHGVHWVYREWPGVDIGAWAEPGDGEEWKPGPGAQGMGYSCQDYIDVFADLEGGEEIYERLIDPRYGAAKVLQKDKVSCLIDDLDDLDFVVKPAPGDHIEDGLQKITDLLSYDDSRDIDATNRPMLYVSEECENLISAFGNYTGEGGKNEAHKDPIDCVRYAVTAEIDHFEGGSLLVTRTGAGGY